MTIKELLGVELPIVQAPMAGVQDRRLAVAVSAAGGLGSLPCAMLSPATMQSELAAITRETGKPFNVNFFCHAQPKPDPDRETKWRALLAPYYRELGVDLDSIPSAASRTPFDAEAADVLAPFRPAVVSFHFGLPSPALLSRVKSWGSTIVSSATTVAEARWLEERGVDVIVAQGLEAGGHRGLFLSDDLTMQLGTFDLVRQIVHRVNTPVIAAGGITDAAGVAAALALGASGVQVGTAYLLCDEATTSDVHRVALKSPGARHTAVTNVFTGRPARGIVNRLMREVGPLSAVAPAFPLAAGAVTPLRVRAEAQGSGDFTPLWCGQHTSGCKEVPAADLTRALAANL